MAMPLLRVFCLVTPLIALAACGEDTPVAAPKPIELTRSDVGHYCRMIVVDHKGPKGQIHIKGRPKPVYFSSVRDTIAFTMLPEEPKRIAAIYVNDMTKAKWENPGPGTWIKARDAYFVIGSSRRGGMGRPKRCPSPGTKPRWRSPPSTAAASSGSAEFPRTTSSVRRAPRRAMPAGRRAASSTATLTRTRRPQRATASTITAAVARSLQWPGTGTTRSTRRRTI